MPIACFVDGIGSVLPKFIVLIQVVAVAVKGQSIPACSRYV